LTFWANFAPSRASILGEAIHCRRKSTDHFISQF
jgi:hypothetical protein